MRAAVLVIAVAILAATKTHAGIISDIDMRMRATQIQRLRALNQTADASTLDPQTEQHTGDVVTIAVKEPAAQAAIPAAAAADGEG